MGVDIGVDIEFVGFLSIIFMFRAMRVAVRSFGPDSLAFFIREGCLKQRISNQSKGLELTLSSAPLLAVVS